jgi:hypothetical protein
LRELHPISEVRRSFPPVGGGRPVTLRPRFSPGLPLSLGMAPVLAKKDPGSTRVFKGNVIPFFGNLAVILVPQQQTHSFASPVFTGFAIIGREGKVLNYILIIDRMEKNFNIYCLAIHLFLHTIIWELSLSGVNLA